MNYGKKKKKFVGIQLYQFNAICTTTRGPPVGHSCRRVLFLP